MFIPCSAIYFLEVIAHLSLKVATSGPFRCKKTSKMSIFEAITLRKNEVVRSIYEFWKMLERLNTYFLEVSADVSLKGGTSGIFRGKKHTKWQFDAIHMKQKRRSLTKVADVFMLTF